MKLVNTNLRKKCSAPAAMRKGRHQFKFIRSQMIADSEPGNEVLAFVDGFGQIPKLRAIAQII